MTTKIVAESELGSVLRDCWEIELDVLKCFPPEVAHWIEYHAVLSGVPNTYIAWPLIVTTSYCTQHAIVEIKAPRKASATPIENKTRNDVVLHREPLVIYALVVGRSGN